MKIFETFECSGQNLSNSLCQFWNNKSITVQTLYPSSVSWKRTPLYFYSSKNIYFAPKEPIKIKTLETFKCSGQNSSNSSCQLWNNKSLPLQVLRNSSLSWQINSLWILSSYFFKFGLKDPIKIPISSGHFPNHKSVEVMLDKSVSNVLGEGMQFLGKCKAKLKGTHVK